jgi:hypothetical protein
MGGSARFLWKIHQLSNKEIKDIVGELSRWIFGVRDETNPA